MQYGEREEIIEKEWYMLENAWSGTIKKEISNF